MGNISVKKQPEEQSDKSTANSKPMKNVLMFVEVTLTNASKSQ